MSVKVGDRVNIVNHPKYTYTVLGIDGQAAWIKDDDGYRITVVTEFLEVLPPHQVVWVNAYDVPDEGPVLGGVSHMSMDEARVSGARKSNSWFGVWELDFTAGTGKLHRSDR